MKTSFIKYGRKDSRDLCEITLTNDHDMVVNVLNYGATLEKVLLFIGMQREKAIIFPPFTPLFTNAHWSTHCGGGQSTETKKVADK